MCVCLKTGIFLVVTVELAECAAVEDVSVVHVRSSDLFLLLLSQRCFLVHAAAELVSPISLGPTVTVTNITVLLTSFFVSSIG